MITTITFNPALDKTIQVDAIDYGKVNRVGHFREDLGGKGINMGRILGGFGIETKHIIVLGKDNQKAVLEFFEKDDMELDYLSVDGYTRTNMKIVERDRNQTTDINEAGLTVTQDHIDELFAMIDQAAEKSDYLIMGGSLAKGMPTDMYGQIARRYGDTCRVVIDADDDVLIEGLKGHPFMVKPNIHELENALDRKLETTEEIVTAARDLIAKYDVNIVVVSMGKEGSIVVTVDDMYVQGTYPTDVVSTVGAGDSMVAGFVYGLINDMPLDRSLAFASACSSLTIEVEGYPKLDLDEALKRTDEMMS
jgi:1-phosphofructokinase